MIIYSFQVILDVFFLSLPNSQKFPWLKLFMQGANISSIIGQSKLCIILKNSILRLEYSVNKAYLLSIVTLKAVFSLLLPRIFPSNKTHFFQFFYPGTCNDMNQDLIICGSHGTKQLLIRNLILAFHSLYLLLYYSIIIYYCHHNCSN